MVRLYIMYWTFSRLNQILIAKVLIFRTVICRPNGREDEQHFT